MLGHCKRHHDNFRVASFTLPRLIRNSQRVFELILQQVRALDRDQQRSFFALRNSFKELSPFEGIVKTNAMPLGTNASSGGIFPNCSRFNHSCCSNASYSWCNKLGLERVFAVQDIKEGEEISVSYLSEQFGMTPGSERRRHLLTNLGSSATVIYAPKIPKMLLQAIQGDESYLS